MRLILSGIQVPPDFDFDNLAPYVAALLHIAPDALNSCTLYRKSVDARRKSELHFTLSVEAELKPGVRLSPSTLPRGVTVSEEAAASPSAALPRLNGKDRPLVVGLGPAGLFAALTLAERGLCPIVIERGKRVDERQKDVANFWKGGALKPDSNVQFGEGGAGAFSDGKLTTGVNDARIRGILRTLYEAGAPESILYDAKPHIGTDYLPLVVRSIRERIISLGGEVRFEHALSSLVVASNRLEAARVRTKSGREETLAVRELILAVGHSARDTFDMLYRAGFKIEQKPFSIGVRIEHSQSMIDQAQYGAFAGHPALGAADYKLSARLPNGRALYTFCMCPGGQVVAAASENKHLVTNGMSRFARGGANANAALLVNVGPDDFGSAHPLAGVYFQQKWERLAFDAGGGNFRAPVQLVGDFLNGRASKSAGAVTPSYEPGVIYTSLRGCLPDYVLDSIALSLPLFERKLKGFASPDAVLTGVETRSSSPIRILRDETMSASVRGVYPAGEGAGYAGGILSAALDGIRSAEALINNIQK